MAWEDIFNPTSGFDPNATSNLPSAPLAVPGGGPPPVPQPGTGAYRDIAPGAAPLPTPQSFMPQLPPPDFANVPQVRPLSTPQVQYSPTRGGARTQNILGALGGFREGMQRSEAIADRRAANKYKTAQGQIATISQDPNKTDEQKQEAIAKILNNADVQRGASVLGIEMPMTRGVGQTGGEVGPPTEQQQKAQAKPGILKRVATGVLAGVTGVRPQRPTGQVDVGALPQMGATERLAQSNASAALRNAPVVQKYEEMKWKAALAMFPDQIKSQILAQKTTDAQHQMMLDFATGVKTGVPSDLQADIQRHLAGLSPLSFEEKGYQGWTKTAPPGKNSRDDYQVAMAGRLAEARKAEKTEPAVEDDRRYRELLMAQSMKKPISPEDAAWMQAYKTQKLLVPGTAAQIRVEGFGNIREYPVIDTKNNNSLAYISANDLNKANKSEPGRFIPSGPGVTALNKTVLLEDIRGAIQQTRASLQAMQDFDPKLRAKVAFALRDRDPRSAVSALVSGEATGLLTPQQQDYLINSAQLIENAMAMRSVLGAGQGSEDLRTAIRNTIPGPATPSREYGLKQLDVFEKTLDRLSRGIPTVPLKGQAPPAGGGTPGAGGIKIHPDGTIELPPPGQVIK